MRLSRRTYLFWMLLSLAISIAWGYSIEHTNQDGLGDFRAVYYGARTVIDHRDPYKQSDFLQVYRQEGGEFPTDPIRLRNFQRAVPVCVNLPSTLFLVSPLALLGWTAAHILWMLLLPAGLLIASLLMLDLAGDHAPALSLFLICVLLANSEVLLQLGNASGLAVSLCVIAVWCFFREKHQWAGVICLAIGLALKPQEIGMVWLYFLLARGSLRKSALQSFALSAAIAVASMLWVAHCAPHWVNEWHSNVAATSAPGDLNDPGPTSIGNSRLGQMITLQSAISYLRDDPHFYNPAACLLGGLPILLWIVITLRSRPSRQRDWLALASISALSLLAVYHRQYDVKLVLLTVPAAAMLAGGKNHFRRLAVVVATAGFLFTADIPLAGLMLFNKSLHLPQDHLAGQLVSILLARTPTIALFLVGLFYLGAYMRHEWVPSRSEQDRPGLRHLSGLIAASTMPLLPPAQPPLRITSSQAARNTAKP